MIGVLLVAHGKLAGGLLNSAVMILGPIKAIDIIELDEETTPDMLRNQVIEVVSRLMNEEGVIILTDLRGATPFNVTADLVEKDRISVITGMNLPLLLQVLMDRDRHNLNEITTSAIIAGREGIADAANLIEEHRATPQELESSQEVF
jgi:PTS system mannose-specific IIA component